MVCALVDVIRSHVNAAQHPPKSEKGGASTCFCPRMAEGEMEVYESFQCTARLYFRSPQRPVEHRCRLTLAGGSGQRCSLTLEGEACQRRTFRVWEQGDREIRVGAWERVGNG